MASRAAALSWKQGWLDFSFDVAMPRFPARPERPQLLPPGRMPQRGRAGPDRSRIALLHALAHIEFVAIDLAWDLVGRFGGEMPRRLTDDCVTVSAEASVPFSLLARRARRLASPSCAPPAPNRPCARAPPP